MAREDFLPGGTKQRAIVPFLAEVSSWGPREFVYAGPFCGFAQIALAYSCQALGLRARLFCQADPATGEAHEYSKLAQGYGATISLHASLSDADRASREYAGKQGERSFLVPLGFAHPLYLRLLARELDAQLGHLSELFGESRRRLWLPVGSGTLARAFKSIIDPQRWSLVCVDVRVLAATDLRITQLAATEAIEFKRVPELFSEPAQFLPTLPSNLHYDAKLWRYFQSEGSDGDVWWNVAK